MAKPGRTSRLLLLAGVLVLPVTVIFYIGATIATPGYNHVTETVSQLGIHGRAHPEIINTGFIVIGILVNTFTYGFYRLLRYHKHARVICILLAICGTSIIFIGIVHADQKGVDILTFEGIVHTIFAIIASIVFIAGTLLFARTVQHDTNWRGWAHFSVIIAVLSVLLLILFVLLNSIEGAIQRSLIAAALLWIEAVSIRTLRIQSHGYY